jgi:hypothetical protein
MKLLRVFALLVAGALTVTFNGVAHTEDGTQLKLEQLKVFITTVVEQAVGELFPPGVPEVLGVIQNSPELVKGGLIVWLNKKMAETTTAAIIAEQRGDTAEANRLWDKVERYQTFYTCVATGDCTKLNQLKDAGAWPPATGTTPGTPTPTKFNDPRTDKGNFVDRCFAFASGCDDNNNDDPVAKPAANEFCKRKGFQSVARGGSKWSYKTPTEILSSGQVCESPDNPTSGCGGLDFVACQ